METYDLKTSLLSININIEETLKCISKPYKVCENLGGWLEMLSSFFYSRAILTFLVEGDIVFGKLNVDENQATSMKYQIMSIPTMLIFKNGNLVDKLIGAMPKEQLKQKLESYK